MEATVTTEVRLDEERAHNLRAAIDILIECLPANSTMWGNWDGRVYVSMSDIQSDWVDIHCSDIDATRDYGDEQVVAEYVNYLRNSFRQYEFRTEADVWDDKSTITIVRVWIVGSE